MVIDPKLKQTRFRADIPEESALKRSRTALMATLAYIVLIAVYIWFSGRLALHFTTSAEGVARFELVKGLSFVLVTGAVLYLCLRRYLGRIADCDSELIAQHKKLINSERLVMAGVFASSVCHDLNNMLMAARGDVETVRESAGLEPQEREALDRVAAATDGMAALTRRMMESGREFVPGDSVEGDLVPVVSEALEFAAVHGSVKRCGLESELPESLVLLRNPLLVSRALMNMVLNAAQAAGDGGRILVRLAVEGDRAVLEVHDDGPGVPEDLREKIFEPFFTSKSDGNGLGLLSLKTCARHHGGEAGLTVSRLGGACFRLALPIRRGPR